MTQVLYNLRTSELGYRVTKFTDGEVESSYLTSDQACDCPAGHRATCRHRAMLPQMLEYHLADSSLFWDYERGYSCDINGNAKRETVACAPAEQDTEPSLSGLQEELILMGFHQPELCRSVPAGQHTAAEGIRLDKIGSNWRELSRVATIDYTEVEQTVYTNRTFRTQADVDALGDVEAKHEAALDRAGLGVAKWRRI